MKSQRGVALITVLVMVALATIVAASLMKRQAYTREDTAYMLRQNQASLYAQSAEAFAVELLVQDSENAAAADYLQESWAQPLPPFPVEDGFVSARILDDAGKFNLNGLLKADGTPDENSKVLFEQLLVRVGLPAELSQSVIDWQDHDDLTIGAMGAENNYYRGLGRGVQAANAPFNAIEELKQVRGFEGKNYDLIAPYIAALPEISTKININTASAEVLASLSAKLDLNSIQTLVQNKQKTLEYFASVDELLKLAPFDTLDAETKGRAAQLFDVKSNYFKIQVEVVLSGRTRQLQSSVLRKNREVMVYARSTAPFVF